MTSPRTLIVYAHSDPGESRHNAGLLEAARAVAGVTVHDLARSYPRFDIDVEREKALLLEHDVVVLQFPMHWYSVPGILQHWFDQVLAYGFAYGPGGDRLRGKRCWIAATVAGPADSYGGPGEQGFDVKYPLTHFFAAVEQTALVCGMLWEPPFLVEGTIWPELRDDELADHARAYAERLASGAEPVTTAICA